MRIAFYPSFRSLDHPNSSGLVSIGRDILAAMQAEGHEVIIPLKQSMEWIYREFWRWPETLRQGWLAERKLRQFRPDCWLTYHSYYRVPDLIGPTLTRRHQLPYFLLAPSYATKYRKQMATWPGFQLNRRAILDADMVFANKLRDIENLKRILPPEKITYIHPGIKTASFPCNQEERIKMREQLGVNGKQVVVTAAMMRPGVKEDGIAFVIECCAKILAQVPALHLLIVGDGPGRPHLTEKIGRASCRERVS
jgi:glycosyltransferase involved in cell wall biosynthesis